MLDFLTTVKLIPTNCSIMVYCVKIVVLACQGESLQKLYIDLWRQNYPEPNRVIEFWQESLVELADDKSIDLLESLFSTSASKSDGLSETKFRAITTGTERELFNLTTNQSNSRNVVRQKIIQVPIPIILFYAKINDFELFRLETFYGISHLKLV